MSNQPTYDNLRQSFDRAVKSLNDNLTYLKNKEGIPAKTISINDAIIKALKMYADNIENIVNNYETEANNMLQKIQSQQRYTENLEAVCILHGVTDFPAWVNYIPLKMDAIKFHNEGLMRMSSVLCNKVDRMSPADREVFYNLIEKYNKQ